jgi:hypothetical protein
VRRPVEPGAGGGYYFAAALRLMRFGAVAFFAVARRFVVFASAAFRPRARRA